MAYNQKYSVEIWNKNGQLIADLGGRADSLNVSKSRNRPDDISFTLDLDDFENYCRNLKINPKQVLISGSSEVRVRRLGTYISGGQIVLITTSIRAGASTITCKAKGFLWLLSQRYTGNSTSGTVTESYNNTRTDILWSLINQTQNLPNGSFGITRGNAGGSTTLYQKTYKQTNIMDAIIDMTELQVNPIDVEFTHDKVFKTYAMMGADRPDIIFEYPGNIIELTVPDDSTALANEVIGRSQVRTDGTQTILYASDPSSRSNYQLRQELFNSDAIDNSNNGLTNSTGAVLLAKKNPIKIPNITINGGVAPFITDFSIGDRVVVKIGNHPFLDDINGMYRIEGYSMDLDSEDNETISLDITGSMIPTNNSKNLATNYLFETLSELDRDVNQINTTT